jgi:hypothetical protein
MITIERSLEVIRALRSLTRMEHAVEISITAVAKNRRFTKSLATHAASLAPLRDLGRANSVAAFDVLQIVFVDRPTDYAVAVGCRGDRLFQVHVGIPVESELDYRSPAAFVEMVAHKIIVAARLSELGDAAEAQLTAELRRLRNSEA